MKPTASSIFGVVLAMGVLSEVVWYVWRHRMLSKLASRILACVPTMQTKIGRSGTDGKDDDSLDRLTDADPYFYKVLIYPDRSRACKAHFWGGGCPVEKCHHSHEEDNSMYQFVSYIMKARQTLDICVYVLTDHELANYVIAKKQRGVRVRVITNQEAQNYTCTQVGKFRASGKEKPLSRYARETVPCIDYSSHYMWDCAGQFS